MERREALSKVGLLLGATIIGANAFANGWYRQNSDILFSNEDRRLLDEIGGTILPPIPGSPGAKSAEIGSFMIMMVTNCYEDNQQKVFKEGLSKIKEDFKTKHRISFLEADHKTRLDFLQLLDEEQKKQTSAIAGGGNRRSGGNFDNNKTVHYFSLMKQLTLLGFFTSKVGCTEALRYIEIPGAYHGCIPYKKGDKAWQST
jgi:hypothetical protein